MGSYLLHLFVTLDQEFALQNLFSGNGWKYRRAEFSEIETTPLEEETLAGTVWRNSSVPIPTGIPQTHQKPVSNSKGMQITMKNMEKSGRVLETRTHVSHQPVIGSMCNSKAVNTKDNTGHEVEGYRLESQQLMPGKIRYRVALNKDNTVHAPESNTRESLKAATGAKYIRLSLSNFDSNNEVETQVTNQTGSQLITKNKSNACDESESYTSGASQDQNRSYQSVSSDGGQNVGMLHVAALEEVGSGFGTDGIQVVEREESDEDLDDCLAQETGVDQLVDGDNVELPDAQVKVEPVDQEPFSSDFIGQSAGDANVSSEIDTLENEVSVLTSQMLKKRKLTLFDLYPKKRGKRKVKNVRASKKVADNKAEVENTPKVLTMPDDLTAAQPSDASESVTCKTDVDDETDSYLELEQVDGVKPYELVRGERYSESLPDVPTDCTEAGYSEALGLFYCSDCMYTFQEEMWYTGHKRDGKCVFVCNVCQEVFPFRYYSRYLQHQESHSGTAIDTSLRETFLCAVCGTEYMSKSGWHKHQRTKHSDEEPYNCDCGQSFMEKDSYLAHRRTKHGEPMLACKVCKKEFSTRFALKRHGKTHHSPQPGFQCNICGATFIRKDALTQHEEGAHSKKKQFVCSICNAGYPWRTSLCRHMLNIHKIRH